MQPQLPPPDPLPETMTSSPMPDLRALKDAFGAFMTGVTVVSTLDTRGEPQGFTANSFTSVSLDPPLLLVCPGRALSCFDAFARCERFAVSILSDRQRGVSDLFATTDSDRFQRADWEPDADGCPVIANAAASFGCRTHSRTEAGDHVVLIGSIERFSASRSGVLGYHRGDYFERPAAD